MRQKTMSRYNNDPVFHFEHCFVKQATKHSCWFYNKNMLKESTFLERYTFYCSFNREETKLQHDDVKMMFFM